MAGEYYLLAGKQKIGPLTERQILDGARSGKINLFDLILNRQTGEWVMLAQHPDFSDLESSSGADQDHHEERENSQVVIGLIPSDIPENTLPFGIQSEESVLNSVYWYEKDQGRKRLKYLEVLSLIHEQKLSEQSLISKSPQGPWHRLIDWDEFSPKSLQQFKDASLIDLPDVNVRRKFPRFECGKIFVIMCGKNGFQGFCPDISKSGMAFLVRAPKANINDQVVIKFADALGDGKFDAKGVVVSARKVRLPGSEQIYIRYGVRFTHLSEGGKTFITEAIKSSSNIEA